MGSANALPNENVYGCACGCMQVIVYLNSFDMHITYIQCSECGLEVKVSKGQPDQSEYCGHDNIGGTV